MKNHPSRRAWACALWLSSLCVCGLLQTSKLSVAEAVDLRGYGRVSASFSPGGAVFLCEDETHADWLMGKLQADLFWDAGDKAVEKRLTVGAKEMVAHAWTPYGWIAVARVGKQVFAVGGANEESLVADLRKQAALLRPASQFVASKPYPIYLDFYDLKAFKLYTHAMKSMHDEGLDSHWPFVKKFGLGGMGFQDLSVWTQCPAPGVVTLCSTEYEVRQAERQHGLVTVAITGGGEVPLWIHNQFPSSMMQPSPTSLLGAWGGAWTAGAHYESWWMPLQQRQASSLAFLRKAMSRYVSSPAVGGWHIYAGAPGAEFGFHERTGEFWDYSPAGQEGFRTWLRDIRELDLKAVGQRWYGDPSRLKSWSEVTVPDVQGFFGALAEGGLRLGDNWQWRKAAANDEQAPPPADADWTPVAMQPSQQQSFLPWGAAFYRKTFDPSQWLKKNPGRDVYLVCADMIRTENPVGVWLNGRALGPCKPQASDPAPFAMKLKETLKSGENELILRIPSGRSPADEGKLFGPVFLTTVEPRPYPYLGKENNHRYADVKEWQVFSNIRYHKPVLDETRALDPDRPLVLSGTAGCETDYVCELAAHYGASVQHTGREAWYHPWWAGLGYVAGFYGTGEPSATTHGLGLDRMLGWSLLDGDSNHNLFWDIEDYIQEERVNGWFTRNQGLLRLFGKSLREKPGIVILRSARTQRLGSSAPWNWDMGRGDLQAAHYDNVYATEREVLLGLVQDYPVLFDDGTEFLDGDVLEAIKKYVENGGTFVALHNTGRHSTVEPDSFPITRLTGFKVVQESRGGKLTFEKNLPVFQGWDGKTFESSGIGLEAQEGSRAVALARWADGQVAVGCRSIGKGRVVVLGSTFWRGDRARQRLVFERLFTDLGVTRNADASNENVWARKAITKNGLQEWLLTFNSTDAELKSDVSFRVSQKPEVVWDMVTHESVPFETDQEGWVKLKDVALGAQGVRIFGVRRADLAGGLPFWWEEKLKYWKRTPQQPAVAAAIAGPTPIKLPATVTFDEWRLLADKDDVIGSKPDWLHADFDDAQWLKTAPLPWTLTCADLEDYRGLGLYRASFTRPAEWGDRRVVLSLYNFDTPIVYDEGEFFINGEKVTTYRARGWSQTYVYDVTDKLKDGENVLAVRVKGGKQFAGLAGGIWLQAERKLQDALDLAGEWQMATTSQLATEAVKLPGRTKGRFVARDVEIPASWKEQIIYLHLETETQWLGSVVVNGRPIGYNGYCHPFGLRTEINVTPYLLPGKPNRIELWPLATSPGGNHTARTDAADIEIQKIRIGCTANP